MTRLFALALAMAGLTPLAAQEGARSAPYVPPAAVKVQREAPSAAPARIEQAASVHHALNLVPIPAPAEAGKQLPRRALRIGDGYAVTDGGEVSLDGLQWSAGADGRLQAVARISLPGVVGFRLGLDPASLQGLALHIEGDAAGADVHGPFTAQRVRAERPGVPEGEVYWLPVVEGDAVRLQLTREAGAATQGRALRIVMASVLRHLPTDDPSKHLADVGRSGSCNLDIMCQYTDLATAVAKYLFTTAQGATAMCTGTLLNDMSSSGTPWFITANHCVSTASQTASMQFYWFFRSSSCNGPPLTPLTTTSGGANLLATNATQDTTFVRLNQAPPQGTARAGWTEALVPIGQQVLGIHHPSGDLKKYSRGSVVDRDWWEFPASPDSHLVLGWSQGTTEPGSSGSGIFNASNQLLAVLSGGGASCQNLQAPDWYGRFDRMMPALAQWLDNGGGGGNPGPGVTVTFSGRVATQGGAGICAMVLINGQFMFSCGGNGNYSLSFPLDSNGSARVFAFADGFSPFVQDITPTQGTSTVNITMAPPQGQPSPLVTLTSVSSQPGNQVALAGHVRNGAGQPLCAMVLANGQHMFSCGGQGQFNLTVPRAPDGSITLFTFVHGMAPFRSTFTP